MAEEERLDRLLRAVEERVQDGRARLQVRVAGAESASVRSTVRLWRGHVLVGWERDDVAGGCLLRPALLRRLVALGARVEMQDEDAGEDKQCLRLTGSSGVVAALSSEHACLVVGATRRAQLHVSLLFDAAGVYTAGEEVYQVPAPAWTEIIRLTARLGPSAPAASRRRWRDSS